MELIKLEDHLRLNIPEIDSQHETLIELINRLHDAMLHEAGKAALDEILSQLVAHTQYHFSYEEQLMSEYGYPEFEAHRSQHNRLMQQLENLTRRFREGEILLSFAVVLELKGWSTIHIEKSDTLLGAFLQDRQGVGTALD